MNVFHFGYIFNNVGVDDHVSTQKQLAHNLVSIDLLHIGYATVSCLQYGWDKFIYDAQPIRILAQGTLRGCKIQKDHLTLALDVYTTRTTQVETSEFF